MLRAAIRDWQIDIVHCHSARGNRFAWPAIVRSGAELITHQRDTYRRDYFHLWLGRADHIIAISNWVRQSMPNSMQYKTTVVYNAVHLPTIDPTGLRRSDKSLTIGMAGRCRPEKGFDLLLKTLPLLSDVSPFGVQLWGVSPSGPDSDYACKLLAIVADYAPELRRRIHFEPFRSDVKPFYAQTDIVVVPSCYHEPFGRMAIEAMAWRRPVIVSRRGGLCEIVEHGRTGLIFDPDSPNELTIQLRSLLVDATLRSRLGTAGFEEVKRRFLPGPHADAIDRIYRELVASR